MRAQPLCLALLIALVALGACTERPASELATVLYFVDREPGGEPYRTRVIVTRRFLRIDDGTATDSYLLYDRSTRVISSVVPADSRILIIAPKAVKLDPPAEFRHEIVRDAERFASIGGHPVAHYRLLTNGKQCYDLYAAEGLLPEATTALAEYREVLAGEQAVVVPLMPKEMRSACDLANHVFLPARHLAHGLPIRYTDMTGRTTELVDFKTGMEVDPALFALPGSYRRITIEEMRGQKSSTVQSG